MKGKFLLSLAGLLLPASMMAPMATAQVAKPAEPASAVDFSRYEVYGGFAYSGADQVNKTSALIGANVGVQAKLKRWFGANADFGWYGNSTGIEKPTVTSFLAGPEFYIPADNITGFIHVLFGGEHTGGVGEKPGVAYAFAVGGGFEYALSKKFSVRVAGDDINAAFVQDPTNQGFSPHRHSNPRATIGVAYRF
ncbi:MAG TPA: outer membrane beta-barrel protein [Acidobacteriaceae bacterium]|nr:outer membrane beta-barrel protein [Acidobacteriaceae bacterium]